MSDISLEERMHFVGHYEDCIREAADFIEGELGNNEDPMFGLTLGSGLGDLVGEMDNSLEIPYKDIPHFPLPQVKGHAGKLILGNLAGVDIIALSGRSHFYDNVNPRINDAMLRAVFPVHVLAELRVPNYFATNAAGGLNLNYQVGDVMVIGSHSHGLPNPLLGPVRNLARVDSEEAGLERFQPMNDAYDPRLIALLHHASAAHLNNVHEGTYFSVSGPSYETEAECRALRAMGADAVGMSTTHEVIVARNRGMRCVGMSCITNMVDENGRNAANHEEVAAILQSATVRDRLTSVVRNFFDFYAQDNEI